MGVGESFPSPSHSGFFFCLCAVYDHIRVLISGAALLRAQEAWAILTGSLRPGVMRFTNTELLLAIMLWAPRLCYVFAVTGIALNLGMSVFSPPFVATQIQIFAIISTALYILILLPPQAMKIENKI